MGCPVRGPIAAATSAESSSEQGLPPVSSLVWSYVTFSFKCSLSFSAHAVATEHIRTTAETRCMHVFIDLSIYACMTNTPHSG